MTPSQGRWCIVGAALLWSLSGAFTKALRQDTILELNDPAVTPLAIAFWRVLFAGLALVPTLRPRDVTFRPMMLVMVFSFASMNATFVSAMALGTAANAILLQYTAPMWIFLVSIYWMGEKADRRSLEAMCVGLVGIGVIVAGTLPAMGEKAAYEEIGVVGLALASGVAYAGVVLCLRVLRQESANWLTVLNHLTGAIVLTPILFWIDLPTPGQLAWLFLFGTVQMALPYWLMARGLRSVSAQEAGTITLLEPLLNPLWAYLLSGETPSMWTALGGMLILGGLAWRYWPTGTGDRPSSRA